MHLLLKLQRRDMLEMQGTKQVAPVAEDWTVQYTQGCHVQVRGDGEFRDAVVIDKSFGKVRVNQLLGPRAYFQDLSPRIFPRSLRSLLEILVSGHFSTLAALARRRVGTCACVYSVHS